MAGEADAIKAGVKLVTGVYKWATKTPVGRGTTAAAAAGAVVASEKASGRHDHAARHHAAHGVGEHIVTPVFKNLAEFLRKNR